jgi:hypothetical protein
LMFSGMTCVEEVEPLEFLVLTQALHRLRVIP